MSRQKTVSRILLFLFSFIILFHLLVVSGLIPGDIVWGGRITDRPTRLIAEGISITLNALMLMVVLVHAGYLHWQIKATWLKLALRLMFALFLLNTIGNLFSKNVWEQMIFTPVTALLAWLSLKLSQYKPQENRMK